LVVLYHIAGYCLHSLNRWFNNLKVHRNISYSQVQREVIFLDYMIGKIRVMQLYVTFTGHSLI
jgi:hypothetical protein